ncbi:MAG: hypothetical protein RLZ15_936, partial [Actinomycetota bacterium]
TSDTLVSFHAGANDVIRPKYNPEITLPEYAKAVRELAAELKKYGAQLMLFTVQESAASNTKTGVIWNQRFKDFNKQVRELAAETGAILNEANDGRYPNDIRFLAFDRLHLNPEGHYRVAQGVLENLGLPFDPGYKIPLPPAPKENPIKKKIVNALWIATFVIPWIIRRLRGKSSGDGRRGRFQIIASFCHNYARNKRLPSSVVEHPPCKRKVVSSILTGGSIKLAYESHNPAGLSWAREFDSREKVSEG